MGQEIYLDGSHLWHNAVAWLASHEDAPHGALCTDAQLWGQVAAQLLGRGQV